MEIANEVWRVHPVYTNTMCSNMGRVKSVDDDELANTYIHSDGYLTVAASKPVLSKAWRILPVHKLVYTCFHGDADGSLVKHINNNNKDNRIENLQLVSRSALNKASRMSKITNGNAYLKMKPMLVENMQTSEKHLFKSKSQAARWLGCSPALVYYAYTKANNVNHIMRNNVVFEVRDPTEEELEEVEMTVYPDKRLGTKRTKLEKTEEEDKDNEQEEYDVEVYSSE